MSAHPSPLSRETIIATARTWLGTPYHHQASLRCVGTDCLGLIRGVYFDLYGFEPAIVPGYSRDWAESSGQETLLAAAREHLRETSVAAARPGDVLLFRWRDGLAAKHAGLISATDRMIHAVEGAAVAEVSLSPWWRRHCVGAFAFPRISD
jgi:NlpC/P60 family putative phage cell wall peptidase